MLANVSGHNCYSDESLKNKMPPIFPQQTLRPFQII
jgi:hypothetical protein